MTKDKSETTDHPPAGSNTEEPGKGNPFRSPRIFTALALVAILSIGFFVRVEDYKQWKTNRDLCFYNNKPLLGALDGYYYLRLARDIVEDSYSENDELRYPPYSYNNRPQPAPLISVMTAFIVKSTGWQLDWVGFLLPPLLGILLAFPLYGFGKHFGGKIAGSVSALSGLLAPYYVYRSGMGWFDTDCMNVTWSLLCAYCFLKFGNTNGSRRYAWFAAGSISVALFCWWWDQTPQTAMAIGIIPLAVALIFHYRPVRRREHIALAVFLLALAVAALWQRQVLIESFHNFYRNLAGRFMQISDVSASAFPAQKVSTSEQVRPSFLNIVEATTRSTFVLIMSAVGLAWMVIRRFKSALYLSALFGLSGLAVIYAERFLIFMIPLSALGLGFIVSRIWALRREAAIFILRTMIRLSRGKGPEPALRRLEASTREQPVILPFAICAGVTLCFLWPDFSILLKGVTSWPKIDARSITGMVAMAENTPSDAIIWAQWDNGHAINYWARRRTLIDGARHGMQHSVYNGMPLATSNEILAANFMKFYAANGSAGITKLARGLKESESDTYIFLKEILACSRIEAKEILKRKQLDNVDNYKSDSAWLRFLFPAKHRPLYIYLDRLALDTAIWWYWYGSWDTKKMDGVHPFFDPFFNIQFENNIITGDRNLRIDTDNGVCTSESGQLAINHVLIRRQKEIWNRGFNIPNGPRFEINLPQRFGAAMSEDIAESLFNRLFIREEIWIKPFRCVIQNAPNYQLWEVRREQPAANKKI